MRSDNAQSAGNQQGSPAMRDPSETTRRAPYSKNELIAYLQGALHDASLNKGKRYRFTQKHRKWLEQLSQCLGMLGYRSWIYKEGKTRNVFALETLAPFLDFTFDPLTLHGAREQTGYIRGFFDAEGGLPHYLDARFYIQFVQKNKGKLDALKALLASLGIYTGRVHNPSVHVDPDYWRFYVRAQSHADFARIVGSWHPIKQEILRERMVI